MWAKALRQEQLGIPRNFREISMARAIGRWGRKGDLERVRVKVQMLLGVQWVA